MPMNLSPQHTVSPNRVTKYGWTALEIAAINGFDDIISLLVTQYGGDVNQENPNNHATPLENAIEGGHLKTVRLLCQGLCLTATDGCGVQAAGGGPGGSVRLLHHQRVGVRAPVRRQARHQPGRAALPGPRVRADQEVTVTVSR